MSTKPSKNQIFHEFCEWLKTRSAADASNPGSEIRLKRYEEKLRVARIAEDQIDERLNIIREALFKIDIERWNRFYSGNEQAAGNRAPNKFMAEIVSRLVAGTALDIGMGQGRNALYLAEKGWKTTGLEASEKGVSMALEQARTQNLKINAVHTDYEKYDWGKNQWDLILLLYVPFKNVARKVVEGLGKNGRLIIETYRDDARETGIFGDKVTLSSNELPKIFEALNIYVYEEITDANDFAKTHASIVRLYAGRPPTPY